MRKQYTLSAPFRRLAPLFPPVLLPCGRVPPQTTAVRAHTPRRQSPARPRKTRVAASPPRRRGRCRRCGRSADALLWVHTPNIPAPVVKEFLRECKRGLFSKTACGGGTCGAAGRLTRCFGCTRPTFRRRLPKSFCGNLRGGFFQKAPLFSHPQKGVSFCSLFLCVKAVGLILADPQP